MEFDEMKSYDGDLSSTSISKTPTQTIRSMPPQNYRVPSTDSLSQSYSQTISSKQRSPPASPRTKYKRSLPQHPVTFLHCPLCLQIYNSYPNSSPVLLFCGHTFCQHCLKSLHKENKVQCNKCHQTTLTKCAS
eukprot:TRINITY_DN11827_c0_g1_i1.p1 TRINITY_DN11827_c0_g1~~TRINITY_DN11827_c0_g1_i1.p1  ORF type:complete len:133 (-),score=7.78 TRINITY_DN11827_c0_g1_i1:487-885(-)